VTRTTLAATDGDVNLSCSKPQHVGRIPTVDLARRLSPTSAKVVTGTGLVAQLASVKNYCDQNVGPKDQCAQGQGQSPVTDRFFAMADSNPTGTEGSRHDLTPSVHRRQRTRTRP